MGRSKSKVVQASILTEASVLGVRTPDARFRVDKRQWAVLDEICTAKFAEWVELCTKDPDNLERCKEEYEVRLPSSMSVCLWY